MPKTANVMQLRAPVVAFLTAFALSATPALADRPMAVTTADAPKAGDAKLELGWDKDDETHGWGLSAGFAPIDALELEIELVRARDGDSSPSTIEDGAGISAKWVPLHAEKGLSAGVLIEYGHTRREDRIGSREHERASGFSALAGWTFESELSAYLNLGREWSRVSGETEAANTWGVAFVQPVGEELELIAELYGNEDDRPDRQIGLRYEMVEGVTLSGAVGRGKDRSIANLGVAWAF